MPLRYGKNIYIRAAFYRHLKVQFFYHIGIYVYLAAALVLSLFNHKAALFINGRKDLFRHIRDTYHPQKPVVWFHCSSVGEFEQARPIIEKMHREESGYQILVTFFSPSGYEHLKNYEYADWVYYLPLDTRRNAVKFVSLISPSKVVFIKYEFWMNILGELSKRGIPVYSACAIFRPGQIFFRWYGSVMRRTLRCFDTLFIQDERSRALLEGIGITNVKVCGDTRFDRVNEILSQKKEGDRITELFLSGDTGRAWVAGSIWPDDERLIAAVFPRLHTLGRLILVPHEIDEKHLRGIEKLFSDYGTVRYSEMEGMPSGQWDTSEHRRARVLIVDRIGILSVLYRYGRFAYVGGGFTSSGIHNILEAATYGRPVVFGPNYRKFREAWELIALGGAVSVRYPDDFERVALTWMLDAAGGTESECDRAAAVCLNYVKDGLGATDSIFDSVFRSGASSGSSAI